MCLGKFVWEPRGNQDAASGFEGMEGVGTPVSGACISDLGLDCPNSEVKATFGMTPICGPRLGK